jgi:uracil-DNA glycosylase
VVHDEERRTDLARTERRILSCVRCPRLVAWRQEAAAHPPPRYAEDTYWARPVPGFGDPAARVYVLALATAAHGGNRTGRALTGNSTADWLTAALHRAGYANQPTSLERDDGLRLTGAWTASAVRCPPPANRPTAGERDACRPHLTAELDALRGVAVIVTLGAFAWHAASAQGGLRPRPAFAHGAEARRPDGRVQLGCYHPSRQNTSTGLLTEPMLDAVFRRARELAADSTVPQDGHAHPGGR